LERKTNVLVHCVYGQSRSAATIMAYLITSGLTITEAMEKMVQCNPSTCINPGFLTQLCFLSECPKYLESKEFRLLMMSYPLSLGGQTAAASAPSKQKIDFAEEETVCSNTDIASYAGDQLICRQCKTALATGESVFGASLDTAGFVKQNVDAFWRGYQPVRSKSEGPLSRIPCKGEWAVLPTAWMQQQVGAATGTKPPRVDATENASCGGKTSKMDFSLDIDRACADEAKEATLICPGCSAEVGSWRRRQLDLIGIYNPSDLYALSESAVRLKRYRRRIPL
jgi:hypothetical protein